MKAIVKRQKYVTRWCLHGVDLSDQAALQNALDNGYEPFSILSQFVPQENKSVIAAPGQPPQMQIKAIQIMYFRMKYKVPVNDKGEQQSITLFKRKPETGGDPETAA